MANTARRLVGGLLSGIGRGLELGTTQRLQEERERRLADRQVALAELEHRRTLERQDRGHEQTIERYGAQAAANVGEAVGRARGLEPFQIREGDRAADREARRDERQYQQRRELSVLEGTIQERLTRIREAAATARNNGDNAHAERMLRLGNELESGRIADVVQDENGEFYGITRGGNLRRSNIRGALPRNRSADPLDSLLEEGAPPTPTPAAQPAPQRRPPGRPAQTYTEADVTATMQATGLRREEVIRQIEARGFRRAQ